MAKLLSESKYAIHTRLVAIDNSGMIGPFCTLRYPPTTFDLQRPGTYIDFRLLDTARKTLQKRISLHDELNVIIHVATPNPEPGTRNQMTFLTYPVGKCQRITHCRRTFDSINPINGKVIENDAHHTIALDAGVPIVVTLLGSKPTDTRKIKLNSWLTFWPAPPTHGIILGKV